MAGFLVAFALSAPPAAAQPAPPSADVDATFQRGLAAFDARDFLGAAAIWEPLATPAGGGRWKVLYNLGLAYQSAGDGGRAVERFEAFAAAAERETARPPELEERRLDALERARTLRAAGAAPTVTGLAVAPSPPPPPPGTAAPPPGTSPLFPTAPPSNRTSFSSTPDAPAPAQSFPTAWVLVGAGLTAVSVALPLALRGAADEARDEAEALGAGHTGYAGARDDYDAARTRAYAAWALPAALGAITAGIAIYGIVHVSRGPQTSTAAFRLGAHASPTGAGLRAAARF